MNEDVKHFIEENIELIENNEWEEIYKKDFPTNFTETLLESGINPLEQALNYIPDDFLEQSKIEEFTIPNSVTGIGGRAFKRCSSLTNIQIPDGVISIGREAFCYCRLLKSIDIPDSVISIGDRVFYNCSWLNAIKYLGNKKDAMQLGIGDISNKKWRQGAAISKVICTDGEILL